RNVLPAEDDEVASPSVFSQHQAKQAGATDEDDDKENKEEE
ncbi:unnamed protein product, partial [Allacma fusca]